MMWKFNKKNREIERKIKDLDRAIFGHPDYEATKRLALYYVVQELEQDIAKQKAILAEVVDYVYGEKNETQD